MADRIIQMRQDRPTYEIKSQRINSILKSRKVKLNEVIWNKRKPSNQIQGYNLSLCKRKYHKKKWYYSQKRCWYCGSISHLKLDCPVLKEKQLWKLLTELYQRITIMEEELLIQKKNRDKREKKLKKKKQKKQKKNYLKKIQAINKAVSIKLLLSKHENLGLLQGTTKYINQAMSLHKSLPQRERILLEKKYQKLFDVELKTQILEALDIDNMIEEFNEEKDLSLDSQNG